jgi:hypothetical protein
MIISLVNVIVISGVAFTRVPRALSIAALVATVIAVGVAIAHFGVYGWDWPLSPASLLVLLLGSALITATILAVFAIQQFLARDIRTSSEKSG